MHQKRSISLVSTQFHHFHFHPLAGLNCYYPHLISCHTLHTTSSSNLQELACPSVTYFFKRRGERNSRTTVIQDLAIWNETRSQGHHSSCTNFAQVSFQATDDKKIKSNKCAAFTQSAVGPPTADICCVVKPDGGLRFNPYHTVLMDLSKMP